MTGKPELYPPWNKNWLDSELDSDNLRNHAITLIENYW